jgi:hypothetical protein
MKLRRLLIMLQRLRLIKLSTYSLTMLSAYKTANNNHFLIDPKLKVRTR